VIWVTPRCLSAPHTNQSRWNLDFAARSAQGAAPIAARETGRVYEVVDHSLFSTLAPDSPPVMLQQATNSSLKAVLDLLTGKQIDSALQDAVDPEHTTQNNMLVGLRRSLTGVVAR
jgi:hypothetical protein